MHSVLALKDRNSTLFGDEQRGRGGGGLNLTQFCPYVSAFLKKKNTQGHKKSRHAKFQPIRSNLENRYEIFIWGRLARSYSIGVGNSWLWRISSSYDLKKINNSQRSKRFASARTRSRLENSSNASIYWRETLASHARITTERLVCSRLSDGGREPREAEETGAGAWGYWGRGKSRAVHFSSRLYFSSFPLSERLEQANAGRDVELASLQVTEFSGSRKADVRERQRLVQLVQLQAQEIDALKDEITLLSRKGGTFFGQLDHPYPLENDPALAFCLPYLSFFLLTVLKHRLDSCACTREPDCPCVVLCCK